MFQHLGPYRVCYTKLYLSEEILSSRLLQDGKVEFITSNRPTLLAEENISDLNVNMDEYIPNPLVSDASGQLTQCAADPGGGG